MAYLGEEIKKLGFGLMRLPQKSEGMIDVEQTKVMVDNFLEAGFTYFDTAWAYAGSEDAIRQALHQEGWLVGGHDKKSANECVKCGKCEEVCPQHIKIRDELEKVAAELLGK